jgi:hypothetical protein
MYEYDETKACINCEDELSFIFLGPSVAIYFSAKHFDTLCYHDDGQFRPRHVVITIIIDNKTIFNCDWQFKFNAHTVHIRRIRRKNQQPTHGTTTIRHTGHVTTRHMIYKPSVCVFQVTHEDPISSLMMAGYCRNM